MQMTEGLTYPQKTSDLVVGRLSPGRDVFSERQAFKTWLTWVSCGPRSFPEPSMNLIYEKWSVLDVLI